MRKLLIHWRWLVPLLFYSSDAHAWGLYTHVYFAQLLLWAVPLSDPRYRRAVRSRPQLVLAGACLPDLSLLGKLFGAPQFSDSHLWQHPRAMLDSARSEEECALALGYASHLFVDVIAHNHFVPAHEKMWLEIPMATHAAAEWAMDHHIEAQLFARPAELLRQNQDELIRYVTRHFGCAHVAARNTLLGLAGAENRLRSSRIPQLFHTAACALDAGVRRRFNYYLGETTARLSHINRILEGEEPLWEAEPCERTARQRLQTASPLQLRHRIPLPQDLFAES
jgi:Zinc dependent phospholipase C